VQGQHTFYLIVDAENESGLRTYLQPFEMAGSVDIYPASTCARVVASGGCAWRSDSARPISAVSGVRTSCDIAASSALRSRSDSMSTTACWAMST